MTPVRIDEATSPLLAKYTHQVKRAEREIIGRDREIQGLLAAFSRPELCNVILLGDAGSGKALTNSTIVPVADDRGYVPMGSLRVGDQVFAPDGNTSVVLGFFPQGLAYIWRVNISDGSALDCNAEHLFTIYGDRESTEGRVSTVADIYDILAQGRSVWIDSTAAVKRDPSLIFSSQDWAMFGRFLSDILVRGSSHLAECVKGLGEDTGMSWVAFLADAVRYHVHIPPYLLHHGSIEQRSVLFKELVNHVPHEVVWRDQLRYFEYDFATSEMRNDVFTLAKTIGLCPVKVDEEKILFPLNRDHGSNPMTSGDAFAIIMSHRRLADRVQITSIERTDESEEMTCIYVSDPSHCFLAGDYVVTHNTALVQGAQLYDTGRLYLELDLSRMIADLADANEMAATLKMIFDEAAVLSSNGEQIVLFIDEFHQIVQLSAAAVEALKPLLADSGTRGIRVVAATTYEEFEQFIRPNQPLVERLQRINLKQPDEELTVSILKGMAERYGVVDDIVDEMLYHDIYKYTNRYIPASSQPRKSLLMLDSMVGWHRFAKRPMDKKLLADVIMETQGVSVDFKVDATTIKEELDKKVLAQGFATLAVQKRLNICVAGLNDPSKPLSSFLFTGSTGVGKTELTKQLAELLFNDSRNLIRFDMTEYANQDSLERFRETLTARVWERPHSVILLDEVEKACAPVTRLLLQVLDDGRLMDRNGREVSFINSYLVLTTNAASEIYKTLAQYSPDDEGSGSVLKEYDRLIRRSITETTGDNRFPPELLGRVDCIVPFQPLSTNTMKRIVGMKLRSLYNQLKARGLKLQVDRKVIDYLVQDTVDVDSNSGGARQVMSKLEDEVVTAIAEFINKNPHRRQLYVSVEGTTAYEDKNKLKSEAYIKVS